MFKCLSLSSLVKSGGNTFRRWGQTSLRKPGSSPPPWNILAHNSSIPSTRPSESKCDCHSISLKGPRRIVSPNALVILLNVRSIWCFKDMWKGTFVETPVDCTLFVRGASVASRNVQSFWPSSATQKKNFLRNKRSIAHMGHSSTTS